MIRPALRRAGYDVTRFPVPGSLWETLGRVFRQERVALVVDVGAHKGEYGAFLREHGYRGAIRSFEPVPSSADEAVRRASSDPGWTVERRAIAAARGTLPIRVARASNLSSFRAPTPAGHARFGAGLDEHDVIEVEVVPLADVVDAVGAPAFLKADTQGFDLEVVRGAGAALGRFVGVQVELDIEPMYAGAPGLVDGLAELAALGFVPAGFWPVARGKRGELLQLDVVLVRK
jgi:FkbM family methyltransferase